VGFAFRDFSAFFFFLVYGDRKISSYIRKVTAVSCSHEVAFRQVEEHC
jgi:hypothetical protein